MTAVIQDHRVQEAAIHQEVIKADQVAVVTAPAAHRAPLPGAAAHRLTVHHPILPQPEAAHQAAAIQVADHLTQVVAEAAVAVVAEAAVAAEEDQAAGNNSSMLSTVIFAL